MEYTRVGPVIGRDGESARRVLRGIGRYAEAGRHWLFYVTSHERHDLDPLIGKDLAGIIAYVLTSHQALGLISLGKSMLDRLRVEFGDLVQ